MSNIIAYIAFSFFTQIILSHLSYRYHTIKPIYENMNTDSIEDIIINKSINRVAQNIDFNENIYQNIKNVLIYNDYINHLDLLVTKFNNFKFNLGKRLFNLNKVKGQCRGMSIKFAKYTLLGKSDEVNFENGADEESIIYQMLYSKIINHENDYFFSKAGIKTIGNVEVDNLKNLEHGIFLIEFLKHGMNHNMVVIKNEKTLLFEPNIGVLDLTNVYRINFKITELPIVDKNVVTIKKLALI